jgi:hypothetical protein
MTRRVDCAFREMDRMRVEAAETSEILAGAVRLSVGEINGKRQLGAARRGGPDDCPPGVANAAAADAKDKPAHVTSGHAVTRDKIDRDRIKPTTAVICATPGKRAVGLFGRCCGNSFA